jgi:hypothetical protein
MHAEEDTAERRANLRAFVERGLNRVLVDEGIEAVLNLLRFGGCLGDVGLWDEEARRIGEEEVGGGRGHIRGDGGVESWPHDLAWLLSSPEEEAPPDRDERLRGGRRVEEASAVLPCVTGVEARQLLR